MYKYVIYFLIPIIIVSCSSVEKEMAAYESLNNNKASAFVIEANIVNDYSSNYNDNNSKYCTSKSDKKECFKINYWYNAFNTTFQCSDKETENIAMACALEKCNSGNRSWWGQPCVLNDVNGKDVTNESLDYLLLMHTKKTENIYIAQQVARKAATDKAEFDRLQKIEAEQKRLQAYIESKKMLCASYGFKEENAIASCVQTEINNEIMRMQQVQAYANAQARANAAQRSNALSNMGRCLSTEGNFGACANAWQGYTPPKVTNCQYDVFGNVIRSTCKTQ